MKLFFPFLFCIIFFSIIESSYSSPPPSKISHLLKQSDVATILELWQTLEVKLNTPCVFISWLRNWEMFHQFLSQLPDLNRQALMNFNNNSATIGTKKQSPKFTSVCNLILSNFDFYSNDLDTLVRNDELLQNYHFLILEATGNFKGNGRLPLHNLQLRNAILLVSHTTQRTSEYFDLDYAGTLRPFQSENVHFRDRWNFHGNPFIFMEYFDFSPFRQELISQFRESTGSDAFLASVMVVSKVFNGTLQIARFDGTALSQCRAHLALWNSILHTYWRPRLLSSIVTLNDGLPFFTARPKRIRRKNPLEFLLMAMDPVIWAFKLGCLSVIVAFILATDLVHIEGARGHTKFSNVPLRMLSLFASLFRLVVQQNITHRLASLLQRTKIKLMIGPWLLGLIILNSNLQTRLTSSLTSPAWITPPKTFDELSKSSYKINTVGLNWTVYGIVFWDMASENHSLVLRLREKLGRDFLDLVPCLATTQTGENVCMMSKIVGNMIALSSLVTAFGEPLFQVSADHIAAHYIAMLLPKKHCHLLKRLNYVVSGYFESGIFQKWFEGEAFARIGRQNARAKLKERTNSSSHGRTNKKEKEDVDSDGKAPLSSIFIVLIGNGLGLIVFGWEVRTRLITLLRDGVVALANWLRKRRARRIKPIRSNVNAVPVEVNLIDIE